MDCLPIISIALLYAGVAGGLLGVHLWSHWRCCFRPTGECK